MVSLYSIRDIKKKIESSILYKILICILLSSIIILLFLIFNRIIDKKNFKKYTVTNDIELMNSVENMYIIKNNTLKLEGYAFYLETDSTNSSISVFLKNLKNNKEIWMDTETIYRADIQKYYECEYNYENSGFIAITKYNKLNMNDGYEIFINLDIYDNNGKKIRKTVSTNRYLFNNTLLTYNPYDFDQPDENIQSELLKKVFKVGKLHFYRKDVGMYVYEYQDNIYWIATKDFQFSVNDKTYIVYHLYTTQNNKLPEDRIQYKFDNLDFFFEDYELIDDDIAPYRIAVRNKPDNYAIAFISTGVYDTKNDTSLWKEFYQYKQ